MQKSSLTLWERMRAYFRPHLGSPEPQAHHETPPLVQVLSPLDDLLEHSLLQARLVSEEVHTQQERDLTQEHREAMMADILRLHDQLETGFGPERLERISQRLKDHCKDYRQRPSEHLTELAMAAVVTRFHQESLEWAWNDFQGRLLRAGMEWPEPSGLSPHADACERANHRQLQMKHLHEVFLRGPFLRFADLILGAVPAWRATYPERAGTVWVEAVYEAVAAALAGQRLVQIEDLASHEHDALEVLIAQALAEPLQPLRQRLAAGVTSLNEARNVADQAAAICQTLAPQVVWEHLSAQLEGA